MTTLGNNVDYNGSASNGSILPNLEQLYLKSLPNLESAFDCPMQPRSLSKLQILEIMNCPNLIRIFNNEAICQLSRLQKLTIKVCLGIEELVLPKLETLVLDGMPNLKNICINSSLACPSSLEVLKISRCPQLKSLPFRKKNATSLRFIRGEQEWWNEMDWATTDDDDKNWLQSFFVPQIQIL
ncbi:Disease resistance protein [Quillaja saponaria]|uniref:Disease resistance protein n=1 Tax=Quillaja saponaria TaxID=32244 RepID=A0AAD7PTS0_QUISA|nr:Disease resistance protein [Quillaja saponaria]